MTNGMLKRLQIDVHLIFHLTSGNPLIILQILSVTFHEFLSCAVMFYRNALLASLVFVTNLHYVFVIFHFC